MHARGSISASAMPTGCCARWTTEPPFQTCQRHGSIRFEICFWRAQPTPTNISAAIDAAQRLAQHNDPQIPLRNLVYLGAIDQAHGILNNPPALVRLRHGETDILF